jgi:trigger factor
MRKTIKHIEENRKAFEIEVSPVEVNKRKGELFEKLTKTAAVPGFRAGKAPRDLLEKHYGEKVTKEVVEDLISDSYYKALEEEGYIPLGLPEISGVKLDGESALSFRAEFNIRPKMELKEYKGLKLNKKKPEIKEEDIQKSIKTLQEANAKYKNPQERPVQIGDYIVCDSEIFIDGKAIAKKRENIWMPIEEKSAIPGLSSSLAGSSVNDEKDIEVTLPEDFQNKEYANKKAVFKIKVKEIKERSLPQIDDEFAKDLGYNSLSELNDSVKKVLQQQAERQIMISLENQVIEKLLEIADFNIPSTLVEEQLRYLVEEEKKRLSKQGLKEEELKTQDKGLQERLRPVARKQVKTMFIMDEIAHKEKIDVSQAELDEALEGIAKQYSQPKQKVEKYYNENDLISNLRADLRNGKILNLLIKEAKIEEGGTK